MKNHKHFRALAEGDLKTILIQFSGMNVCGLQSFPCKIKSLVAKSHTLVSGRAGIHT